MASIDPSPSTLLPWYRRLDENKGLLLFAVCTAQVRSWSRKSQSAKESSFVYIHFLFQHV